MLHLRRRLWSFKQQKILYNSIKVFSSKIDYNDKVEDLEKINNITWVGLYSNVGLTGLKAIVALQSGSTSLMADAFHSASDICSDVVSLAAINYSRKPPDKLHPYGYGHYETLATIGVSAILMGGGVGMGYHALQSVLGDQPPLQMVPAALGVACCSVLVKEWLFRATVKVGVKTHSPVIVANAWHHRSDAFSSIVALIGIGGSAIGIPHVDPVAGILVSGMIIRAGAELAWDGIQDLTDRQRSSDAVIVEGVYEIANDMASQEGSGVVDVHDVKVRRLGHYSILDLHLFVDARLSVTAGYLEKNRIKRKILAKFPNVSEIFVHIQAHPSKSAHTTSRVRRSLSFAWPTDDEQNTRSLRPNFEKTARSHFEIEKDVKEIIDKVRGLEPVILELTHSLVHYDHSQHGRPKIAVEVNLRMDKHITLIRAEHAARVARAQLLAVPDIDVVDIHVELLED